MTDYIPIDCNQYSEYELAIMRHWKLRIVWQDTQKMSHIEILQPRDLQTRKGEEFLIAETMTGERFAIRLDQITEAQRIASNR